MEPVDAQLVEQRDIVHFWGGLAWASPMTVNIVKIIA